MVDSFLICVPLDKIMFSEVGLKSSTFPELSLQCLQLPILIFFDVVEVQLLLDELIQV